jgi:hypothetical protein
MFVLPSIEFSFSASPLYAALLIVLAAGLSYIFYRFTLPPVARSTRTILSILRGGALALVLILLLEPVLRTSFVIHHPPVVAILADRSASMTIVDRTGNRAEQIRNLLTTVIPGAIPAGVETEFYSFGTSLRGPLQQPFDTLGDETTDIAGALLALARERERFNIRAVVMLSDGMYTEGENPVYRAGGLGIPVFTVGIGDTAQQKDVLVSRITANDVVYAGTTAPVDVVIKSSGYGGEKAEVTLNDGTRTLDRTVVVLPAGTAEVSARLSYSPEGEGSRRYTVRVSSLPGELTAANNRRLFGVRVLRSTMRVVILAAGPSPDLSVIRGTLTEDPNISVRTVTQKLGGGYYEGTLTRQAIDSADCILSIGMPDAATASGAVELVRSAIAEGKKPLFFVAGKFIDPSKLLAMAPSLPVVPEGASPGEQEVEFVPDPSHFDHPLLALGTDAERDVWDHLPPVFATRALYRLREGAVALGSLRIRNVILPQPFMAVRDVAETRSLSLMGYGLWRWRLMAQGNPDTAPLFASFLSSAIRWLTSREEGRSVRVAPTRDQFSRGEPVTFSGQAYNANSQPVEDAQVSIEITGEGEHIQTDLHPLGGGRYEGAAEGLPPGEFTFRATATRGGHEFGGDAGSFLVGGLNLEYLDTRMNAEVLQQIAYRTAGGYLTYRDAGRLREMLGSLRSLSPRVEQRTEALELHRWPYVLALVIALFSAEWIIRKRSGMI